jgi:hypothetical protein
MPRGRKSTEASRARLAQRIQTDTDIIEAIKKGLEWGSRWEKPYDRAVSIWSSLNSEGFQINRKRKVKI